MIGATRIPSIKNTNKLIVPANDTSRNRGRKRYNRLHVHGVRRFVCTIYSVTNNSLFLFSGVPQNVPAYKAEGIVNLNCHVRCGICSILFVHWVENNFTEY